MVHYLFLATAGDHAYRMFSRLPIMVADVTDLRMSTLK